MNNYSSDPFIESKKIRGTSALKLPNIKSLTLDESMRKHGTSAKNSQQTGNIELGFMNNAERVEYQNQMSKIQLQAMHGKTIKEVTGGTNFFGQLSRPSFGK